MLITPEFIDRTQHMKDYAKGDVEMLQQLLEYSKFLKLEQGVYEKGGLNYKYDLVGNWYQWPELSGGVAVELDDDYVSPYGVCDNYTQVLTKIPELNNPDREFCVFLTPMRKSDQPEDGGWRWHKWGPYIGNLSPQCEYLYDEPEIDLVYVYSVLERLSK